MPSCESMFVSRSSRKATVPLWPKLKAQVWWPYAKLVGDHSQVLRVLGCRTCNLTLVVYKSGEEQLCVEQNPELFTDTGRGGASMQCMLPSCMSPLP